MAICAKYLLLLVMAQLDLFGNITPPSKPAKTAGKAATILPEKPAEDAIFVNNGNAGFKVKLKTPSTAVEPLAEVPIPTESVTEAEQPLHPVVPVTAEELEPLAELENEELPANIPQEIQQVAADEPAHDFAHVPTEELPIAEEVLVQEAIALATVELAGTSEILAELDADVNIDTIDTPAQALEPAKEATEADYLPYPPTVPLEAGGKRGRLSFKEMEESAKLLSVPSKEELYQKQYYSISTVASWFNVNISLLRFWENEFDIIQPRKTRKGDRLFRPQDVENLQIIHYLLRIRKFSIQGAKQYLEENKSNIDTQVFLQQTLQNFKIFLTELKANLES